MTMVTAASQNRVTCVSRLTTWAEQMTLDWDPIPGMVWQDDKKTEAVESKRSWIVLFMKTNTGGQMLPVNILGRRNNRKDPFKTKDNADIQTSEKKLTMNTATPESSTQLRVIKHPTSLEGNKQPNSS